MSFLRDTRDSYDTLSVGHLDQVSSDLREQPIDRALFKAFADSVLAEGGGPVADVGCGAGRVTGVLRDLGLDVFGVDLSPAMVALAREAHPDLRFEVGSMLSLEVAAGSLAGLLACYSIIHVPWSYRPRVFAEFHRVLAPGGLLMLAFQVGSDSRYRDSVDGLDISLTWYRQQPDELADLLTAAGFAVRFQAVRAASLGEPTDQGFILAARSAQPAA